MKLKILMSIIVGVLISHMTLSACTAAIVGGGRSVDGRTLLWKHRDTSSVQNFIARARGERFDFVALFNAGDSLLREAWAGVNSVGFAVINTQSYNLAPDTAVVADREGLVMAEALGRCRTIADFEALLDELPRPLGVQANFGVMQSDGTAAWFETDDWHWRRFDVDNDSIEIRTNFSCSGTCGQGLGRERYAAARTLLGRRDVVAPHSLTDTVSCSFYPDEALKQWIDKGQYIPRRSTSASVVIEQGGVMTVRPGYPLASDSTYTVTIDEIPVELRPDPANGWHSPAWLRAQQLRDKMIRKNKQGNWIVEIK